jgi:hypothetical protein
LIIDPAPLAFFDVKVFSKLCPDFKFTKKEMERDGDSLFNEKILVVEFEKPYMYSRLMKLLTEGTKF